MPEIGSPPSRADAPVALPDGVEVRLVRSQAEYAACEGMSRDIWGVAERNIVPRELLLTMQLNGGLVHGAFLPDGKLIGFCFAFAGMREGRLRLCSHQLGVLPRFRNAGVGIALKLAQRRDAMRLGYELITWTFDPLEARNAYINLHRLGCIARLYDRDHYGPMEDDLNRGLPSDRFEAEWWIAREKQVSSSTAATILTVDENGEPVPGEKLPPGSPALIQIPSDFQAVKQRSLESALRWRLASRGAFEECLEAGLIAVDFLREGMYVMGPPPWPSMEPS